MLDAMMLYADRAAAVYAYYFSFAARACRYYACLAMPCRRHAEIFIFIFIRLFAAAADATFDALRAMMIYDATLHFAMFFAKRH